MSEGNKKDVLSNFGKFLMQSVRDETLELWDMKMAGALKDTESLEVYQELSSLSEDFQSLTKKHSRLVVDLLLHCLLQAIDDSDEFDFASLTTNGNLDTKISEISDGLSGELYTEDGWIQLYSSYSGEGDEH